MNYENLYITTKEGKIYLTNEQEAELRTQIKILDAKSVLDCMGCTNPDVLSSDNLEELANQLDSLYYDNMGDAEVAVVKDFNLIHDNILSFEDDEDEDDDDESQYLNAVETLDVLNLDDTAYNYYKEILDDMFFKDKLSVKNGDPGYKTYSDVIADALKTADQ